MFCRTVYDNKNFQHSREDWFVSTLAESNENKLFMHFHSLPLRSCLLNCVMKIRFIVEGDWLTPSRFCSIPTLSQKHFKITSYSLKVYFERNLVSMFFFFLKTFLSFVLYKILKPTSCHLTFFCIYII